MHGHSFLVVLAFSYPTSVSKQRLNLYFGQAGIPTSNIFVHDQLMAHSEEHKQHLSISRWWLQFAKVGKNFLGILSKSWIFL